MVILFALVTIYAIIATVKWIKWNLTTKAMIFYIHKKTDTFPSDEDAQECMEFVIKNTIKDLTEWRHII